MLGIKFVHIADFAWYHFHRSARLCKGVNGSYVRDDTLVFSEEPGDQVLRWMQHVGLTKGQDPGQHDCAAVTPEYKANRQPESDRRKKQRTPQAVASQELCGVKVPNRYDGGHSLQTSMTLQPKMCK